MTQPSGIMPFGAGKEEAWRKHNERGQCGRESIETQMRGHVCGSKSSGFGDPSMRVDDGAGWFVARIGPMHVAAFGSRWSISQAAAPINQMLEYTWHT